MPTGRRAHGGPGTGNDGYHRSGVGWQAPQDAGSVAGFGGTTWVPAMRSMTSPTVSTCAALVDAHLVHLPRDVAEHEGNPGGGAQLAGKPQIPVLESQGEPDHE